MTLLGGYEHCHKSFAVFMGASVSYAKKGQACTPVTWGPFIGKKHPDVFRCHRRHLGAVPAYEIYVPRIAGQALLM
jgi:hypothetical protein